MSVAHQAVSESHTGTTGSASEASFSWTHSPGGAPQGVLVFTFVQANADNATAVTYGGVALTAVSGGRAVDTATEPGDCKAWFLGTGIPTGDQTVVVTRTNNANIMHANCVTVTATRDTRIVGTPVLLENDGAIAEQAVDTGGVEALRYAGAMSGGANPLTQGANSTYLLGIDFGARVADICRETTAGAGSRSVGFAFGTSDDRAAVHLAIAEVDTTRALGIGRLLCVGLAVGVAFTGPDEGRLKVHGYAPTVAVAAAGTTIAIPVGHATWHGLTPAERLSIAIPVGPTHLTGRTPTPTFAFGAAPGKGGLVLHGLAPALALTIPVGKGGLVLHGLAPTAAVSAASAISIAVGKGAVTLTGRDVGVAFSGPSFGVLGLHGLAPVLLVGRTIAVPAGHITVAGQYVAVAFIQPAAGSLVVAGRAPTVFTGVSRQQPAGALTLHGLAPVAAVARKIAMPAGALLLTGRANSAQGTVTIAIPVGVTHVTGRAVTLASRVAIPKGAIVVHGLAVSLNGAQVRPVPAGVITLHGLSGTLARGIGLQVGRVTAHGLAPTLARSISLPVGHVAAHGLTPALVRSVSSIAIPAGSLTAQGLVLTKVLGGVTIIIPQRQLVGSVEVSREIVGTTVGFVFSVGATPPPDWNELHDYAPGSIVAGEGNNYYALDWTIGDPPPSFPWLNIHANTEVRPDSPDIVGTMEV